ncbi:MAG TPA: 4-aminobutyrate--2-oxoglutarate transaminase, partial [Paracoccaceae bacterium]|nr:4-aminobutyrate--2-oxoglutarate transaminase [Paracoccaceae bacterium]
MPTNAELKARQAAAVARGVATKAIYAARAENAELWDVEGRRYVDFAAGIAVTNTGHRHPKVMAAVAEQARAFTHTCVHVSPYETYVALAERLNALAPGDFPKKTLFLSTGAEAVENAIKIARYATGRSAVIAFTGAFHGRTMLAMALTGKVMPYKKGFGPFPAEVYHATFPHAFHGLTVERALDDLERLLAADVDPARVAAFIVEPVQGEGGFNVAPPEFLRALRDIADRHGILLIADEIQSGMARTGRMFGIEHSGVVPDLMTLAKGLGGGFPISAVTGRAELMDAAHPGGLGGTYGGNPISIAAAHAVLGIIEEEGLCARAAEIGQRIEARLKGLAERQGMEPLGEVRGLGAMQAVEFVTSRASRAPDAGLTSAIVAEAEARGLILLSCGTRANVVRLLPPLTIPFEVLDEGLDILEAAIEGAITKTAA